MIKVHLSFYIWNFHHKFIHLLKRSLYSLQICQVHLPDFLKTWVNSSIRTCSVTSSSPWVGEFSTPTRPYWPFDRTSSGLCFATTWEKATLQLVLLFWFESTVFLYKFNTSTSVKVQYHKSCTLQRWMQVCCLFMICKYEIFITNKLLCSTNHISNCHCPTGNWIWCLFDNFIRHYLFLNFRDL